MSSIPSSHATGQRFEPRHRQYFKLLLDPGDFHSNPSGLLSFNKSETVLWTIAKILLLLLLYDPLGMRLECSLIRILSMTCHIERWQIDALMALTVLL